jgi:hypothetical protein
VPLLQPAATIHPDSYWPPAPGSPAPPSRA